MKFVYLIRLIVGLEDGAREPVLICDDVDDHTVEIEGEAMTFIARHKMFEVPQVIYQKGGEIRTAEFRFGAGPEFDSMVHGYSLDLAPFTCWRLVLTENGSQVDLSRYWSGYVNGAPMRDDAATSDRSLIVMSEAGAVELTPQAGMKSDSDQKLRDPSDRALEYSTSASAQVSDPWKS